MAIQVSIDGYDSLEQIGIGGMAAVYKARKVSIDKTVAVKVLFPYLATDESYIERFHREAKAAASIQHENIVNVIDFGESGGAFFIVMEYYDGLTLEQLMKARPAIPADISVQILLEVAYGLEAAHALDIVHRDIKPGNIIYTNQGGIKIADFGLARKSDSITMITQHGKVIGTPAYMSPEQAAGRPVGPSSDIFSLGVVAYELLSRRKPFEGKTYSEVLENIQTREPPSLTNLNPLIAPEFERVVARALAKDERERYATVVELIADLEAAMEKNKLSRDRRRLSAYVKDPDSYDAAYLETTLAQCLSRGSFYMQKGHTHLDEAILEFRRILFLDPGNDRARKNIEQLRAERGDENRTVTMNALSMPGAAGAAARTASAERPSLPTRRGVRRRIHRASVGVIAAAVVATLWLVWAGRDRVAAPRDESRRTGQRAAMTTRGDSFHEGPNAPARGTSNVAIAPTETVATVEPSRTMTADMTSPSGTGSTLNPRSSSATVPEDRTATGPDEHADTSAPAKPIVVAQAKPRTSTRPVVTDTRPGTLSAYFLGGVGELWLDGKPYAHQPPFDRVNIPAGTYRFACRMSGDAVPRELTVTIRPGSDAVIEYEMGGEPVVTVTP